MKGITHYSEKIPGARGNFNLSASYDLSDGYLGISQYEEGKVKDRVLLSPAQVRAMMEFIERKGRKSAA